MIFKMLRSKINSGVYFAPKDPFEHGALFAKFQHEKGECLKEIRELSQFKTHAFDRGVMDYVKKQEKIIIN